MASLQAVARLSKTLGGLAHYLQALLAAVATLTVVGLIRTYLPLPSALLLYRVPLILEASEGAAARGWRLAGSRGAAGRLEAAAPRPRRRPDEVSGVGPAIGGRLDPRLAGRRVEVQVQEARPRDSCAYAQVDQFVTNLR